MWFEESVFYQIYPLGFCGAPHENDGHTVPRIRKVLEWIPHLQRLHISAVYFSPVFESDRHGYDTRDYRKIDCRLGTNEDFAEVCRALHANGIRVVLDGVFNHVGRGFWAFQDVLAHREGSRYRDWFHLDFGGNSRYNDGLWYEGWEGHFELVKLNLNNPEVVDYLLGCVRQWVDEFGIDGLRLDVAYCLNEEFMRRLRTFCDALRPDFLLLGEILFGYYNRIVNDSMLHSCPNYECRKSLYSSLNDLNLFELAHSLNRQFGGDGYALYRGKHLLSFVDNHDVTRAATILREKCHLPLLYGLLFGMPGVPCVYYGSEWGIRGEKGARSDDELRPALEQPEWNDLTGWIAKLAAARRNSPALCNGSYRNVLLTNRQIIFERAVPGERVLVAINADSAPYTAHFDAGSGLAEDLITGATHDFGGGSLLPPYSVSYWRTER